MQIKQEKIPDVTCIKEKLSRLSKQGMRETTTFFKYSNTDSCSVGQMYAKTYSVQSLIFTSKFTHFHKSYTQQKCLYPQINCPKSVYYYIKRTRRRINVAQTSISTSPLWEVVIRKNKKCSVGFIVSSLILYGMNVQWTLTD